MNNHWMRDGGDDDARRPGAGDSAGLHVPTHDGTGTAPRTLEGTALPALDTLVAALRPADVDPDARDQAIAAFRDAHGSGAHRRPRTRWRDDWRPRPTARRHAWKAAIGTLFAGLTLGSVAYAVNGTPPHSAPTAPPTSPAAHDPQPQQSQDHTPARPEAPQRPDRPNTSQRPGGERGERSEEALCRAASRQRRDEAASAQGKDIRTYCARLLAETGHSPAAQKPEKPQKPQNPQKPQKPEVHNKPHDSSHGPDQSPRRSRHNSN